MAKASVGAAGNKANPNVPSYGPALALIPPGCTPQRRFRRRPSALPSVATALIPAVSARSGHSPSATIHATASAGPTPTVSARSTCSGSATEPSAASAGPTPAVSDRSVHCWPAAAPVAPPARPTLAELPRSTPPSANLLRSPAAASLLLSPRASGKSAAHSPKSAANPRTMYPLLPSEWRSRRPTPDYPGDCRRQFRCRSSAR